MNDPTYFEKGREQGRLEGRIQSMESRFSHVEQALERIETRLARMEKHENQLSGVWWVFGAVGTVIAGVFAVVVGHFWK